MTTVDTTYVGETGYLSLLAEVLAMGETRKDRTGVGTIELYDQTLTWPFYWPFPRMTHRYLPFKPARVETCWLLQGRNDLAYLHDFDVHTWDRWAKSDGTLGPVYGVQLRQGVDQLKTVAHELVSNPYSRRLYWTMWNAQDLEDMALPPCHHSAQFYVEQPETDPLLHMTVFQRSADLILGLPTDLMMYGIIHRLMARYAGMAVGTLTFHLGATHIYKNLVPVASRIVEDADRWQKWAETAHSLPALKVEPAAPSEPWEVQPNHLSVSGYTFMTRYSLADLVAV